MGKRKDSTKWIQDMNMDEGAFTAKAKAAGKTVAEYATEKAGAPGKLGKEARLSKTFSKMRKGRKKKRRDMAQVDGEKRSQ